MYISRETPQQIHKRLLKVIASAEFKVYEEPYVFEEFPIDRFAEKVNTKALALVRDDSVWSQLVPSADPSIELFTIFRFHFKEGLDNSGFVGWLASYLKDKLGTGVFVTCGQNTDAGGIFDYWGCPLELGEEVIREVEHLITQGNNSDSMISRMDR